MSVKRDRRSLVVSTLAILFLGLAGSAWGHGFSRGAFGRTGVAGLRGPHSGGLLLRLIFPCRGADGRPSAPACSGGGVDPAHARCASFFAANLTFTSSFRHRAGALLLAQKH